MMQYFRVSGLVVAGVFAALMVVLTVLFLDGWIKLGVESAGGELNKATVNLNEANFKFLEAAIKLDNLEVADPADLTKNRLAVDNIEFAFSPLDLLSQKVIIDTLFIEGIKVGQARQNKAVKIGEGGEQSSIFDWPSTQLQQENLPNIEDVLAKASIKSPQMYQAFSDSLSNREIEIKNAIAELPTEEELKALEIEYKQLESKVKKANVIEKVVALKEMKKFLKKVEQHKNEIKQVSDKVKSDVSASKTEWKELRKQVAKDSDAVMDIVNLSPDGLKHIATALVGESALPWLELVTNNLDIIKRLAKKDEGDEEIKPAPRMGMNIDLSGNKSVAPHLWIKQSKISGGLNFSDKTGSISGEISNIADQLLLEHPLTGDLSFTLNNSDHETGSSGALTFSAQKQRNNATFLNSQFKLNQWPIEQWQVPSVGVNLAKAAMNLSVDVKDQPNLRLIQAQLELQGFTIEKLEQSNRYSEYLIAAMQRTNVVKMTISQEKIDGKTKFSLSSNLDKLFFNAVSAELEQKVAKIKQDVSKRLEDKLGGQTEQIESQLAQLTGIDNKLSEQIKQLMELLK